MNYINYKKNTLNKLKVSDINMPIPNLKNENKTQVISEWLIQWLDSVDFNNYLLPTKAEFAYSLGVSLGTVQNVFKILEDKGYILLKQRIGAVIRPNNKTSNIRKQTSKVDIATEKVKDYILKSNCSEGEKLMSARKLAVELQIPLNTTRLAINKLISDDILIKNNNEIFINNIKFKISEIDSVETLVDKVKNDLKLYISKNFSISQKLPSYKELAEQFKVSVKTIHSAIKLLEKEGMLLSRRGAYGTIVVNTSLNAAFEPRREMSIFASAQDTAFYHYEKTINKIKKIISENYGIGTKLPSIREFSEMLDLSPNTIRKALNHLAEEGILRFARGRYGGTFVIDTPDVEEQTFRWLAVTPGFVKVK